MPVLANPPGQDNRVSGSGIRVEVKLLASKKRPRITSADRLTLQKLLNERLTDLGIKNPIFQVDRDDKLTIIINKLDRSIEPTIIRDTLTATGKLELREQKIGTEKKLASVLVELRALKSQREGLINSPDRRKFPKIAAIETTIDRQQAAIIKLFHRPTIVNKDVANAVPEPNMSGSGSNFLDIFSNDKPQPTGRWDILLEFDPAGGDAFAGLTKKVAGTGRSIGIFLDGELIAAPTVPPQYAGRGIVDGKAVIGGNFTATDAKSLAGKIRSGVLPVPIEIANIQKIKDDK
jgi:preprotein translocase subunit SecD